MDIETIFQLESNCLISQGFTNNHYQYAVTIETSYTYVKNLYYKHESSKNTLI